MAGHSRWAQVKHKKAGTDAKRSALFSKLSRLITIAGREGAPDPATNAKLRTAMEQAQDAGLPKENIERAVSRARGTLDKDTLVSRKYEAYGPGGSAYLIHAITDNANRTASEMRAVLSKFGGKLAGAGSVAWMFERRALITLPLPDAEARDRITLILIDAGAVDIETDPDGLVALIPVESVESFQAAMARHGLKTIGSATAMISKTALALTPEDLKRAEILQDALEKHPDVTTVSTNIDFAS